jgi:hypothetical protein
MKGYPSLGRDLRLVTSFFAFVFTVLPTARAADLQRAALGRTVLPQMRPNRTPIPSKATPKPTATPKPAPCITITSPANRAVVSGSVAIYTHDLCSGVWFEGLYVDSVFVSDFAPGQVVFNSLSYASGNHVIEVASQSENPGSVMLGRASITIDVASATPTPVPTSTPIPRTPTPTGTPTPAVCLSITAPAANATVGGSSVPISTHDVCSGVWFESLYVDGVHIGDYETRCGRAQQCFVHERYPLG